MSSPFPAIVQAANQFTQGEINARTMLERYGYDLLMLLQQKSSQKKGVAFDLAVRLVVLGVDGTCDQQWRELADKMLELRATSAADVDVYQLHLLLLREFPRYEQHCMVYS